MSFVKPDVKPLEKEDTELQQTMCQAHGCPHRWIINDAKGKLCRWHHYADPMDWPGITSELRMGKTPVPGKRSEHVVPMTPERQRAMEELKNFMRGSNKMDRSWAKKLKEREEAGDHLSVVQKQLWRDALKHRDDKE